MLGGRVGTAGALAALCLAFSAASAEAESSLLLEAPADRSGIAAITFNDEGAAVGQSSFELEKLADGHQKMTVRMAVEGGGHNISEALFAPVYGPVPTIAPAEKRSRSVDPISGTAGERSGLPSVSSAPIRSAAALGHAEAAGDAAERGPMQGLRLLEQRSQATRADGTALDLLIIDHAAGHITCVPDGADPSEGERLALPKSDRVVNVPMQLFFLPLVRGETDELRFQIAMCKDGPAFYEMIAVRGPRKVLDAREVLEIRYGPDFGKTIAFLASRLMPKFSFWFDVKTGGYLGHRMPLHRDGPEITLVRAGITPPAIGLDWR